MVTILLKDISVKCQGQKPDWRGVQEKRGGKNLESKDNSVEKFYYKRKKRKEVIA